MEKKSSRSINWRTTTTALLWHIIVMIGPVGGAHEGDTLRRVADGGDGPSLEVDVTADLHYAISEIDWTPKRDVNSVNVISSVVDTTTTTTTTTAKSNGNQVPKKPRILCLHGGESNTVEFEKLFDVWPESIMGKMDLVFINATFANMNDGFNWFDVNTFDNLDECYAYIEDRMIELGPFDGMLGFSQGAVVVGAAPGLQRKGLCLKNVEKIKHVVVISGTMLGGMKFPLPNLVQEVFYPPINTPSLHIFGENDVARFTQPELVEKYVDPLVIYHHAGHEVPKLDEEGLKIFFEFLKRINAIV